MKTLLTILRPGMMKIACDFWLQYFLHTKERRTLAITLRIVSSRGLLNVAQLSEDSKSQTTLPRR